MQRHKQNKQKNTNFFRFLPFSISEKITRSLSDNKVIKVLLWNPLMLPTSVCVCLSPLYYDWVELSKHTLHLYTLIVFTPTSFSLPQSSSHHRRLLTHACSGFLLFSLPLSRSLPFPPVFCGSVKVKLYPDSCTVLHSCHVSTHIPGLVWPK